MSGPGDGTEPLDTAASDNPVLEPDTADSSEAAVVAQDVIVQATPGTGWDTNNPTQNGDGHVQWDGTKFNWTT